MVETSKVGVKVGMVGRGVMVIVDVCVLVVVTVGVPVCARDAGWVAAVPQAERISPSVRKIKSNFLIVHLYRNNFFKSSTVTKYLRYADVSFNTPRMAVNSSACR